MAIFATHNFPYPPPGRIRWSKNLHNRAEQNEVIESMASPRVWENDMDDDGMQLRPEKSYAGDVKKRMLQYHQTWILYEALISHRWKTPQTCLPPRNVLLDDYNMAWVTNLINEGKITSAIAHEQWPGDFGTDGLPGPSRPNRGRPCKTEYDGIVYYITIANFYHCVGDEMTIIEHGTKGNASKFWNHSHLFTASMEAIKQEDVETRMIDQKRPPSIPREQVPMHLRKYLADDHSPFKGEFINMKITRLSSTTEDEAQSVDSCDSLPKTNAHDDLTSTYSLRPRPTKGRLPHILRYEKLSNSSRLSSYDHGQSMESSDEQMSCSSFQSGARPCGSDEVLTCSSSKSDKTPNRDHKMTPDSCDASRIYRLLDARLKNIEENQEALMHMLEDIAHRCVPRSQWYSHSQRSARSYSSSKHSHGLTRDRYLEESARGNRRSSGTRTRQTRRKVL